MLIFLLFLLYLLSFVMLSSLLAPIGYQALLHPMGVDHDEALLGLALLGAAFCLPVFLRALALNSWAAAGYTLPRAAAWAALAKGLLIGIVIMLILTCVQLLGGIREFSPPPDRWSALYLLRTIISGLLSGLAVGLIEETFFRGVMHTGMRRKAGFWTTALLTAVFYASVHFMKPGTLGDAEFDITNALSMTWAGLSRMVAIGPVFDSFLTLVVVGVFLSMVRERTGNILWVIGIHAGWVAVIKVYKYLTDTVWVEGARPFWIGSYDGITGWMATLWLGTIAAIYWYRTDPKRTAQGDTA